MDEHAIQQTLQCSAQGSAGDDFLISLIEQNQCIIGLERLIVGSNFLFNVEISPNDAQCVKGADRLAGEYVVVIDVDSTLIKDEVIDVLAQMTGRGPEVAQITQRAMNGDLEFGEALSQRVGVLAGLPQSVLGEVVDLITIQEGAQVLIDTLLQNNCHVGLVSGGFSQVVTPLANKLGLTHATANTLEIENGRLSGRILGPIIDRAGKAKALSKFAHECGVSLERSFAIGDGANDVEMIELANLGIGFNPKALLRVAADAVVDSPYLSDCLYVMGFVPSRAT